MLENGSIAGGLRPSRRGNTTPRQNARGGIQKRSGSAPRMDRDGDLDMDSSIRGGRGRLGKTTRQTQVRGRPSSINNQPKGPQHDARRSTRGSHNPFNTDNVENIITRGLASNAVNIRGRAGIKMDSVLEESREDRRGRNTRASLDQISIRGWKDSKAATNPGGGTAELIGFLERKASTRDHSIRIPKSRVDGDTLIISVKPADTSSILHLNNFSFAGATLLIEQMNQDNASKPTLSSGGAQLKEKMTSMLGRRYNSESKLLDLSALGSDPEFANSGMFDTPSTQSKFFPAIMKVCDSLFTSATQKREAVLSVTIANNNLPNLTTVTTLAQTFPDLKNLDLSNNNFQDLESLEAWRRKFRSLDHLVMLGNPLESNVPNYQEEIIRWFPTLRSFNSVQVRTDEEIAATRKSKVNIPIAAPDFRDEASIGENFLKHFFPAYDSDRGTLVGAYYDVESTFSYSVNVSAVRAPDSKTAPWDAYIKKSRNLRRITNLPTRMARSFRGTDSIREMWATLPSTRHADLMSENAKWCIECHALPGLPDPSGQSPSGLGGLIIVAHGEFGEVDVSNGSITAMRSFDRTFVLGPGSGFGGIRVVNDIMVIRAHGGHEAWKPDAVQPAQPALVLASSAAKMPLEVPAPTGFGLPGPGKTEEQVQKELIALELSKATRLTLEYSAMALEQTTWNLEAAGQAFEQVKATLPPEAFF